MSLLRLSEGWEELRVSISHCDRAHNTSSIACTCEIPRSHGCTKNQKKRFLFPAKVQ